jgi:hypothetical protein
MEKQNTIPSALWVVYLVTNMANMFQKLKTQFKFCNSFFATFILIYSFLPAHMKFM